VQYYEFSLVSIRLFKILNDMVNIETTKL